MDSLDYKIEEFFLNKVICVVHRSPPIKPTGQRRIVLKKEFSLRHIYNFKDRVFLSKVA